MTRAFVLGVAGGSGSGKSFLADRVAATLGADVAMRLEHDAYYRDLPGLDPAARAVVNFDHPDALDNERLGTDLDALRAGRAIAQLRYDFATHTRRECVRTVGPLPVVVIDGILLLSVPALRARLDFAVFVDTPEAVRLQRRLDRDVRERGRTPESVHAQCAATVRPMHEQFVAPSAQAADLVVSGCDDVDVLTARVVREVHARIAALRASDSER